MEKTDPEQTDPETNSEMTCTVKTDCATSLNHESEELMKVSHIVKLPPGSVVWDQGSQDSVKGLHVRVGSKTSSWYLYYRNIGGIQRRPKVGAFPEMGLKQARQIAKVMKSNVGLGNDPSVDRQLKRKEATINEVFQEVYENHYRKDRYIKSGWAKEAQRLYHSEIRPKFGSLRLSEVGTQWIRDWHDAYDQRSYITGNRARSVLSRVFTYAIERGFFNSQNPVKGVKPHLEEPRQRVATTKELGEIYQALKREYVFYPVEVIFLFVLFLTGARPRAIERAEWRQLERVENGGILRFSRKTVRGKTENEVLHLPPQVMNLIDSLPKEGPQIFGIKAPRKLWNQIRKEIGCPDLWMRDSRRTYGSIALSHGQELGMIGQLMNHKDVDTTNRIYARASEDSKLKVATEVASLVEGFMKPKGENNDERKTIG